MPSTSRLHLHIILRSALHQLTDFSRRVGIGDCSGRDIVVEIVRFHVQEVVEGFDVREGVAEDVIAYGGFYA